MSDLFEGREQEFIVGAGSMRGSTWGGKGEGIDGNGDGWGGRKAWRGCSVGRDYGQELKEGGIRYLI